MAQEVDREEVRRLMKQGAQIIDVLGSSGNRTSVSPAHPDTDLYSGRRTLSLGAGAQ